MQKHLGAPALLEVGTAELELINPPLKQSVRDRLIQLVVAFLNSSVSYVDCRSQFIAAINSADIIDRIKEVVDLSDEPFTMNNGIDDIDADIQMHKKTRPWTANEDLRLLAGIYKFGIENWSNVAKFIGNGRTRAQAAQRWTRVINPRISKEAWTTEEDNQLFQLVKQYGNSCWKKVAAMMGNRSDVQCRYHYNQMIKDFPFSIIQQQQHDPINGQQNQQLKSTIPTGPFVFARPIVPAQPRSHFPPMFQKFSFPSNSMTVQITINKSDSKDKNEMNVVEMIEPDVRYLAEQRIASDLRSANDYRIKHNDENETVFKCVPRNSPSSQPNLRIVFAGPEEIQNNKIPNDFKPPSLDCFLNQFK